MDRYPSVDEVVAGAVDLTERHPLGVRLRRVGTARSGEPLWLLSVGRGSRNVLIVAGPHSNEPVGGGTVLSLARRAATDPRLCEGADTTWNFLLCLDPDGARLNKGWQSGPYRLTRYHRQFYRPGFAAQPEWLPEESGTGRLPETRALLAVQDQLRPYLQCSLHGVDVGGGFVEVTRALDGLPEQVARAARELRVPLEVGPYDALYWPTLGPGVFEIPPPKQGDQFAAITEAAVQSTWFHPQPYGTVTAVVEAPMWGVDGVADGTPHPDPRPELLSISDGLRAEAQRIEALLDRVRPELVARAGQFLAPVEEYLAVSPALADAWHPDAALSEPSRLPPLTRAHVMALRISARRLMVRSSGLLHRALTEGAAGRHLDVLADLDASITRVCAVYEEEYGAHWIPVGDQVEFQSRVVLAAFSALAPLRPFAAGAAPGPQG
ncbi:M14 family zinc carboxypeptidase [Streptomyces beijiangensis]|uniref:M14 family zinc carboxypeptidase n=1 Tax=Streptomyces beijiangensis TaxID=163361 RepID=UPI0027DAD2B5|nr:M14 family zinc carboxypeptidase [Streptomyces beijiangensis]